MEMMVRVTSAGWRVGFTVVTLSIKTRWGVSDRRVAILSNVLGVWISMFVFAEQHEEGAYRRMTCSSARPTLNF